MEEGIVYTACFLIGFAGSIAVWKVRKWRNRPRTAVMATTPVCDHDWRKDPEGWKDDTPWLIQTSIGGPEPDIVRRQSLVLVCLKCGTYDKKWRKIVDADDWPVASQKDSDE